MARAKSYRRARAQKKKKVTADGRRLLWKAPGFQAFAPNPRAIPRKVRGARQKQVPYEPVIEPETGIHSRAWAEAIVKQDAGFLRLPLEIRMKIYEMVIQDWSFGRHSIAPRKNRMKFQSANWLHADKDTAQLYLLCRQVYVDVVGTGFLYSQKLFYFGSPTLMLNYLFVIHPVHRSAIQSLELHVQYSPSLALNSHAFELLPSCHGLKNLFITIYVSSFHCRRERVSMAFHSRLLYTNALPSALIAKLTAWTAIKKLRNLRTFRLEVEWVSKSRRRELVKDIEEEIRSVVVGEVGKQQQSRYEVTDFVLGNYERESVFNAVTSPQTVLSIDSDL